MSWHELISVVACMGHLALAVLFLLRRGPSPLALPLALLSLDLFGSNFAELAYDRSRAIGWHYLDRALSPLTLPIALHVVCIFVGKARRWRYALGATYLAFALLAMRMNEPDWEPLFITGVAFAMALAAVLLGAHLRQAEDEAERTRTRLILAAFGVGTVLGATDLWSDRVGLPVPPLANIATLLSTVLIATVALRMRLLGRELSNGRALFAALVAAFGVVVYLAVLQWLGGKSVVTLGVMTLVLGAAILAREVSHARAIRFERMQRLATMGRFSGQLAHDLKNPLTALHGALEFLDKEQKRGKSLDDQAHFLDMMAEQVTRLRGVVDDYERLARVEAVRLPIDINELVRSVMSLESHVPRHGIEVQAELGADLPDCDADRDLLATALDNLLRNAFEAMTQGGTIIVKTEIGSAAASAVVLSVEDQGKGMDAREKEQAFDDFFTTKAGGSGMGLAFVRRVAEAHGGAVSLTTQLGRGTVVRIQIPVRADEPTQSLGADRGRRRSGRHGAIRLLRQEGIATREVRSASEALVALEPSPTTWS